MGGCPDCPGGSNDTAFGSSLSDWVDVTAAELLIFGTGFDLSSWEKPKNMHWDDFRAGQKFAKGIARRLSIAGSVYFVADLLTMGITGKGISDHIDSYIWTPNPTGIGFIPVTKIPGK